MKQFLIKISLFLIPLLLLFFSIEYQLRKNTFQTKAHFIQEHKDQIEVMILGSSQNWRAINPAQLKALAAPLAHGGSALNVDLLLFEKFQVALPKLQMVIFELGYHNLEDFRDASWNKNHLFHIYYGINNYHFKPPLRNRFLLTTNPKEYLKKLISGSKGNKSGAHNQFGFIGGDPSTLFSKVRFDSTLIEKKAAKYMLERHTDEQEDIYTKNTKALSQTIKSCLEKNIQVVLLAPPKHHTYNRRMKSNKLDRRDKFLARYSDHPQVHIWNFERTFEYQSQLFANPDHLTPKGAAFFTAHLDSLINEVLESPKTGNR